MSELPEERLSTTDEKGRRVYLYPATVRGKFHSSRQWVHGFLMLLFLGLPWIPYDGKQLLLLDIAHREFFFFGFHFRSHDAPLLIFLFLAFLFLLGFITVIWGRLWCGWACPQTVFTEFLFRRIERWIEGPARKRKEMDRGPLTGHRIFIKSLKWAAFTLVSLVFTHSFLAYFVGSEKLLQMITGSPFQNWQSFLVIFVTTSIVLFDFGWFREQFCIIACPYGRFQSVMLDSHSLVVGYDPRRGEPRRGSVPEGEKQGDCVNCYRCVQVCPTGIDIRRGLQMECIACTACIDACDEVMTKTKRPLGLISYTTLARLSGRPSRRLSVKAVSFFGLLLASLSGLGFTLWHKDFLETTILRAPGAPYEILHQGSAQLVVNHFRLDLSNQTGDDLSLKFLLQGEASGEISLIFPQNPLILPMDANQRVDFFVRFSPAILVAGSKKIVLEVQFNGKRRELELSLVGPDA